MQRKYYNNVSRVRDNGEIAISPSGRAFADFRTKTSGSRVKKVLGKRGPFSEEFKQAIMSDHLRILEMPHLVSELEAAKKTMKALQADPNDKDATNLLSKMQHTPTFRAKSSILCPIWRHEHLTHWISDLTSRYVFERVRSELYLVTVLMRFCPDLYALEDAIHEERQNLNQVIKQMSAKRRGVVMVGSLEPDLRTRQELTTQGDLKAFLDETGCIAPLLS